MHTHLEQWAGNAVAPGAAAAPVSKKQYSKVLPQIFVLVLSIKSLNFKNVALEYEFGSKFYSNKCFIKMTCKMCSDDMFCSHDCIMG